MDYEGLESGYISHYKCKTGGSHTAERHTFARQQISQWFNRLGTFTHAIWHVFVIAGSGCHYLAILSNFLENLFFIASQS